MPADRLDHLHQRDVELAGQLRELNREALTPLNEQVRIGEHEVAVGSRIPAVGCAACTTPQPALVRQPFAAPHCQAE